MSFNCQYHFLIDVLWKVIIDLFTVNFNVDAVKTPAGCML